MTASRRVFLAGLAAAASACGCSGATRSARPAAASIPAAASSPSAAASAGTASTAPTVAPSASPSTAPPRGDLLHGPRAVPAVALTFHGAGDPALCRRVLAEAASAGARVTVLAVGSWLHDNPELAGAIVDAGHDLGNHTWSHLPMRRLTAQDADHEIGRAADQLVRLTGSRGRWFRPSGTPRSTATIRAAARRNGYARCLGYDVDPLDYTDPGADVVAHRVLDAVRPGSIVSLHLGHAGTVTALPRVLDGLARKGLRPVTVTALLGSA